MFARPRNAPETRAQLLVRRQPLWQPARRRDASTLVEGRAASAARCGDVALVQRAERTRPPPPRRGRAEPPNWLAFCGAASCRPRAAGRRQASPSRAAQRLPRTQLVRGDALARTTAARVRDARTSSRFSERYRPRGENSRPRARDGWNAGRNFLASDAFWCPRRPSTTPEREEGTKFYTTYPARRS